MPHVIVEYAEQLENDIKIDELLHVIHNAIAGSGLYKANQIKTRAYSFNQFTNADGAEPYIHIQARIKSGRDTDNKKQLSAAIIENFRDLNIPASAITVEVVDMERESYGKV